MRCDESSGAPPLTRPPPASYFCPHFITGYVEAIHTTRTNGGLAHPTWAITPKRGVIGRLMIDFSTALFIGYLVQVNAQYNYPVTRPKV